MHSSSDILSEDDLVFPRSRIRNSEIDEAIGLPGLFDFKYSGTTWRLEKMQSEKIRNHVIDGHSVADVGGVCIATQVEGPSIGLKAVAKVKMQ